MDISNQLNGVINQQTFHQLGVPFLQLLMSPFSQLYIAVYQIFVKSYCYYFENQPLLCNIIMYHCYFRNQPGFLKQGYPQIIHFIRIFHCKPSISGQFHFWNSSYVYKVVPPPVIIGLFAHDNYRYITFFLIPQ